MIDGQVEVKIAVKSFASFAKYCYDLAKFSTI